MKLVFFYICIILIENRVQLGYSVFIKYNNNRKYNLNCIIHLYNITTNFISLYGSEIAVQFCARSYARYSMRFSYKKELSTKRLVSM